MNTIKIKAIVEDIATDSWKTVNLIFKDMTEDQAIKQVKRNYRVKEVCDKYMIEVVK